MEIRTVKGDRESHIEVVKGPEDHPTWNLFREYYQDVKGQYPTDFDKDEWLSYWNIWLQGYNLGVDVGRLKREGYNVGEIIQHVDGNVI